MDFSAGKNGRKWFKMEKMDESGANWLRFINIYDKLMRYNYNHSLLFFFYLY